MKKIVLFLLALAMLLSGCQVERYVPPDYSAHAYTEEDRYVTLLADLESVNGEQPCFVTRENPADLVNQYNESSSESSVYDMRWCDVSDMNISAITNLEDISFTNTTIWPDELPSGFDPDAILEFNKNPGLGIRALHEDGITGAGIGIAIIDQALLLTHEQYEDNLMLYEKIHSHDSFAQIHGGAVASLAVGKDIGVAPDAKLYYIASTFGHYGENYEEFDASIIADCILRIIELNKNLPSDSKIRVISISRGYSPEDNGYEELMDAIERADRDNIFVITTSLGEFYDIDICGLGRDYWSDPDNIQSYYPSDWYAENFFANPARFTNAIFVPMDSRTLADAAGPREYQIAHEGGLSWAVPWLAGLYALCCQVKSDLTPNEFLEAVMSTAVYHEIEHDNSMYQLGPIVNPAETVNLLKNS
ncbi:S8 family serine peptidase [Candidatus Avoscillospira sp. LCP25S3_F1]|uniref:S8 family serine peptidase n=1 Tax=Candidatus Avoscillospira sp. LCP25S3_F1 TaxID=3438825 RepID=UPI003F8E0195